MLKKSIPTFAAEMREMKELLQAEQPEVDRLRAALEELEKQFYLKTATYSLSDWEREFGIEQNNRLTVSQRRAQILAKLNTTTPASVKMLENLVQQILGADVTITEHPEKYSFDVYVSTQHIADNFAIAKTAVYEARPAHLSYNFVNALIRTAEQKIFFGFADSLVKTYFGELEKYKLEKNVVQEVFCGMLPSIRKKINGKVDNRK